MRNSAFQTTKNNLIASGNYTSDAEIYADFDTVIDEVK